MSLNTKFLGCMLGGAVGDALGYPVEFKSYNEIKQQGFISSPKIDKSGIACVSDDTQMSILTAYGLLQSDSINNIFVLYTKWINIMYKGSNIDDVLPEFSAYPTLFAPRMTGMTCYHSLQNASRNTTSSPNNSKGNGAIMRIAPVGLMYSDPVKAFTIGMNISLLTHGHPIGYIAGGLFASIISMVLQGKSLLLAIEQSLELSKKYKPPKFFDFIHYKVITDKINLAIKLAQSNKLTEIAIQQIGKGFIAEETLALAIYCVLKTDNFKDGILMSVNHGGDSDTVGAVTGNLLGVIYGVNTIPQEWIQYLEHRDLLISLANNLYEQQKKEGS